MFNKISIAEALKEALQIFKNNLKLLAPLTAGAVLLGFIPVILGIAFPGIEIGSTRAFLFLVLPEVIISTIVALGFCRLALMLAKGKQASFKDFFLTAKLYVKSVFAMIIVVLGTVLGIMLLIVPGIIFAVMTAFTIFVILDYPKNSPMESIKRGIEITSGSRWQIFGLLVIVFGTLILLGLLLPNVIAFFINPIAELTLSLSLSSMYVALTNTETEVDQ